MIVELNKPEAGWCWYAATNRHMAFCKFYKNDEEMLKRINSVDAHAVHCKAEMAAAKAIGMDARRAVHWKVLAGLVRVRGVKDGQLLVGTAEPPRVPLINVRMLDNRVFEVLGWILTMDAKRPQWLTEYQGFHAFAVPDIALRPMNTFPRDVLGQLPEGDVP